MKTLARISCVALAISVMSLPVHAQFGNDRYMGDMHMSSHMDTSVSYSSPSNAAGRIDYWSDRVTWRVNDGLQATNLSTAQHSLRLAQSEYRDLYKTVEVASANPAYKAQADLALKNAQKEIDKLYAKIAANDFSPKQQVASQNVETTPVSGGASTAATTSTAAISGTTLAIGAVVVAGAATAIALGASSGGSSSTPSH